MIGRHFVEVLSAAVTEAVAISRSSGVDGVTGVVLAEALSGVQRVIDVTNSGTTDEGLATAFFAVVAQQLQRAAEQAGVERLVVLSIVGVDRLTSGYLAAKRAHERASQMGAVPAVVRRPSQLHEIDGQVLGWGR